jgi:hypothetical protein
LTIWAVLQGAAHAAPGGAGETARALIAEVERESVAHEPVGPALSRAKEALSRAQAALPTRAPLLEATALEWAEVARDLARASAAERASDRLEQDASATQTEIARVRAAVEQTMARVGRARQDLKDLEGGAAKDPAASGIAPAKAPSTTGVAVAIPARKKPAPRSSAPSRPASDAPATPGVGR